MSYAQYPSATPSTPEPPKKDNRNLIYGLLIAALVLTWGYLIYDKSKTRDILTAKEEQISKDSLDQALLQQHFNQLSSRADSLTENNQQLQGALAERKAEIDKLKQSIAATLSNKNASAKELTEARKKISELQNKLDDLYSEIERLNAENQQLTASNEQLNQDKTKLTGEKAELQTNLDKTQQEKARVEDLASTLHASNINIVAIQMKGDKEKETTKAKKADLFKVSFDIDENRVAPSGAKQFYVIVYNPDGSISMPSGNFAARDGSSKPYTSKVDVNYEQGKVLPVSFNWKPGEKFETGDYRIEIYNNGFKIGEGRKTLKKNGFLGL